jgi:putative protease
MNKKIEILAPAGSYDGMRAAMNAGCDAVYMGGSSFGARAYAENPEEVMLIKAIDEAHIRGKKLYLTVNTLLKEKELTGQLYKYLENYYLRGLDAVIVQDVGVLHFIHQHFPELPIHASTQMTLTMAQGAELLKAYGVTRMVTSRELSLQEIKAISENTDMEIETFVHGALCYCYSGQCLMSSLIGGRSGNRGRCAQPCRMPYQLYSDNRCLSDVQERYLISPKDINTLAIIPELVEAGIDSFKIEGRMKRPEYAAATSYIYRKYVDLYFSLGAEGYRSYIEGEDFHVDMLKLQDVYNRGGFSQGYGRTYHGKQMMSLYRPNHSGVLVGKVKDVKNGQADIILNEKLNAQDVLEIRRSENKLYEFTVKDQHGPGEVLKTKLGRNPDITSSMKRNNYDSRDNRSVNGTVHNGDEVYRTRNNALLDYLTDEYLKKDAKYPIKGRLKARLGERLSLTLSYGEYSITAYHNIVEQALKQPLTKDKIKTQLDKTGDTFFYFEDLIIDADDNIFIPVVWLNELRRNAVAQLEEEIIGSFKRSPGKVNHEIESRAVLSEGNRKESDDIILNSQKSDDAAEGLRDCTNTIFGIAVSVQTMNQWRTALAYPEITAVYVNYESFQVSDIIRMSEETTGERKSFYLTLPHICRLSVYNRLKKDLSEIIDSDMIKGYIVKNYEEISLLKSLYNEGNAKKQILLNYNMYVYNKEAKSFWNEFDITRFTAPVELNSKELRELGASDCDILVYGYLPFIQPRVLSNTH